ncbi:MJ0042-type zinc finger domain-containing protein [Teredinibacter turnerae]|uniref:MJ0042-type zinc finger domain-containing protein n=1 Tax=Teredinibacter turnerae TaxID=2426 RepID=UPI0030CB533C
MADSITRCPKCHTSFRITQAHLSSAKGAVRCGSCLNIFNAKEHLVAPGEEPTPAASAPTKKPARPLTNKPKTAKPTNRGAVKSAPAVAPKPVPKPVPAAQNIRDDDDILISDDMDIDDNLGVEDDQFSHDHHDNIIYSKSLSSTKSNLFERTEEDDKDKNDENKPDESWALSLLEDSEDDTPLPSFRKDSSKHVAVEDVQRASRHTATGDTALSLSARPLQKRMKPRRLSQKIILRCHQSRWKKSFAATPAPTSRCSPPCRTKPRMNTPNASRNRTSANRLSTPLSQSQLSFLTPAATHSWNPTGCGHRSPWSPP